MNRRTLSSLPRAAVPVVMVIACLAPASALAEPVTPSGFELPPLSLDPGFAGDGRILIPIAQRDILYKSFIEASGQIVLFGESDGGHPSTGGGIMQRVSSNGTLGTLSRYPASVPGCTVPRGFYGALQLDDGSYLTSGYVQDGCTGVPRYFDTFRLAASGTVLMHFDTVAFNNQVNYAYGVAQQADGRVILAGLVSGTEFVQNTIDFGVARLMSDGSLDTSFANGGTFIFDFESDRDNAYEVLIDQNGRILVGGFATSVDGGRDILVLALDSDGNLDASFADNGIFHYDRAGFADVMRGMALHPDGRLLLAATTSPAEGEPEFSVLALTEDGELDPEFGNGGLVVVDFGGSAAAASAITIGPGGLIHVAGWAEVGGTGAEFRDAAVTVLGRDGTPDPRFNTGVAFTFAFADPADALPVDFAQSIAVDRNGGRILVAGVSETTDASTRHFGAARFIGVDVNVFRDSFEPAN